MRILLVLEGETLIEESMGHLLLRRNTVLLCRPEEPILLRAGGQKRTEVLELVLAGSLVRDYAHQLGKIYGRVLRLPEDRDSRALLKKLVKRGTELSAMDLFHWISGLHEVAKIQIQNLGQLLEGGSSLLADIAERNAFSVKSIALELGCTVNHLSRSWTRYGHSSLVRQVRDMRLALAKRLLEDSDLPLDAIAGRCGFSCGSAFCASFKKEAGKTPGAWRKLHRSSRSVSSSAHQGRLKPFKDELRMEEIRGHDERPVCLWNGPFFQFDGGEVSFPYHAPYNLALNSITTAFTWVCTLEGRAEFEIDGKRLQVEPGTVVIHPKPLRAKWHTPDQQPWKRVWIHMRDDWSIRLISELSASYAWAFKIPLDSEPVSFARKWVERWNAGRGIPSIPRSRSAYKWLCSWESLVRDGKAVPLALPNLLDFQTESFCGRIGTISDYAEAIGFSRAYLSRRLGEQWNGGTPFQIVRRHRLAQAAHELRSQRNEKIRVIGERALYANTSAFIAAFKKEFGMTPLAYRHRNFE
ncbi:helix-turn-helix domain-containing protein [Puniceicoccus vermicola]|uniref:Helix-turn-helix domain-containing protein n=1 Tax=Puniceicoccus vermicola TaxID=388746 RepID=A0A7X1E5N9_9BACT|nr:helix-turn-helix domain-containing protein [Puniceicoccus vermicola]